MKKLRHRMVSKLIISVGLTLLVALSTWAVFNIRYQKAKLMQEIVEGTNRLTTTIKLGTHYAMMLNARNEINQIIHNIAKQKEIITIRIYNKAGQIKFSNRAAEVDTTTNIKAEACIVCHRVEPPITELALTDRKRMFHSDEGHRMLGMLTPIDNDPSCADGSCHFHPADKKILGALDVVVSLSQTDQEIFALEKGLIALAAVVFILTSTTIFIFVHRLVNRPVSQLIAGTQLIARGAEFTPVRIDPDDEMGQLATAIRQMGHEIKKQQVELNKQRDEYHDLFELVPCLITVQDRSFRIIRYNRLFADKFGPINHDYCYRAYKGRSQPCADCPVEKTFVSGKSQYSEQTGVNRDGRTSHWIVVTAPVKNERGDIAAAMEMSLDVTQHRELEAKLVRSEKKYHVIFNYIPNPVLVVDVESLEILDCNDSVQAVYGFGKQQMIGTSLLALFKPEEREDYRQKIISSSQIQQAVHLTRDQRSIYVNIRISVSEFEEKPVFLITISDITKRLETEQQLIQASKMTTLGEMASGIAHELNQPLSVIKTASSFMIKKIAAEQALQQDILAKMLTKIDGNVDRATRIIQHMRQFARKSDMKLSPVQVNRILESAADIFSQQLKVRGIQIRWDLDESIGPIMAEPNQLEQVFINLLINARDAIEERWEKLALSEGLAVNSQAKAIYLRTRTQKGWAVIEIEDTGTGVPPAVAEKIFEPFFTTKEVGKGTGLGLSISYGIVKECGGEISIEPGRGQGAKFILNFPIKEEFNETNGTARR